MKVCNEHQLVSYIEDPYANNDFKGYQKLAAKLKANPALAHLRVGMLAMQQELGIQKILNATQLNKPEVLEGEEQKTSAELVGLEINKEKISPDCV